MRKGRVAMLRRDLRKRFLLGLLVVLASLLGGLQEGAVQAQLRVRAWGDNSSGQLGDGSEAFRSVPFQINSLTNVGAVAGGGYHSLALKKDGTVWDWGYNFYGQLGDGTTDNRNTPVQVTGLANIGSVAAGGNHSLALAKNN